MAPAARRADKSMNRLLQLYGITEEKQIEKSNPQEKLAPRTGQHVADISSKSVASFIFCFASM